MGRRIRTFRQVPEEEPYPDSDVTVIRVSLTNVRPSVELEGHRTRYEISFEGFLQDLQDEREPRENWNRLVRALSGGTAYFLIPDE